MIRNARTATAELQLVGQRGSGAAFCDGLIVSLLNPKSIGFFIAFVP
jgi:threonine/homoserine/homoserine lactone efflux protein